MMASGKQNLLNTAVSAAAAFTQNENHMHVDRILAREFPENKFIIRQISIAMRSCFQLEFREGMPDGV